MPHNSLPPELLLRGTATQWSSTAHLQTRWDWRAVGNFVGGGTGAGLLLAATLLAPTVDAYRVQAFTALAIIAIGLLCIMLKIGRPTRAYNMFLRVRTKSWMTREGFVMPALFGFGALSLFLPGVGVVAWLATASALFFLYCQARILLAAKGIPAWSQDSIVPLVLATGLVEGAGVGAIFAALRPDSDALWVTVLLLAALGFRQLAWARYRGELEQVGAPDEATSALYGFAAVYRPLGQWTPALLLIAATFFGGVLESVLVIVAALLAVAMGWGLKYTIVTRAAFFQRKSFSLSAAMAGRGQLKRPGS